MVTSYFIWGKNDAVGVLTNLLPASVAFYNLIMDIQSRHARSPMPDIGLLQAARRGRASFRASAPLAEDGAPAASRARSRPRSRRRSWRRSSSADRGSYAPIVRPSPPVRAAVPSRRRSRAGSHRRDADRSRAGDAGRGTASAAVPKRRRSDMPVAASRRVERARWHPASRRAAPAAAGSRAHSLARSAVAGAGACASSSARASASAIPGPPTNRASRSLARDMVAIARVVVPARRRRSLPGQAAVVLLAAGRLLHAVRFGEGVVPDAVVSARRAACCSWSTTSAAALVSREAGLAAGADHVSSRCNS